MLALNLEEKPVGSGDPSGLNLLRKEGSMIGGATTSLAAVFTSVGEPLTLKLFSLPDLKGGEVLARIRCATICGSDLHSFFGRRHSPIPSVLGHEMVGEVVAIGPNGDRVFHGAPLKLADRVTWSTVWSCGECFYCRHGLRPKCERLFKFGHEEINSDRSLIGGMTKHCWLPESIAIFRVPQSVPDFVASPANCATSTIAAVFRYAGAVKDEIVVHGAGMLGLTTYAMAAAAGASQVIVLEPDPRRREKVLQFGASLALESSLAPTAILANVKELTGGRGVDAGLEFAGYPESIEPGVTLLRMGGRFLMAGATFSSRAVQIEAEQLVRRMTRLHGTFNYGPEDL